MLRKNSGRFNDTSQAIRDEYEILKAIARANKELTPTAIPVIANIAKEYFRPVPTGNLATLPAQFGFHFLIRASIDQFVSEIELRAFRNIKSTVNQNYPNAIRANETIQQASIRHAVTIAGLHPHAHNLSDSESAEICVGALRTMGVTVDGKSKPNERKLHLLAIDCFASVLDDIDTLASGVLDGTHKPTKHETFLIDARDAAERILLEHEATNSGKLAIDRYEKVAYPTNANGLERFREKTAFTRKLRRLFETPRDRDPLGDFLDKLERSKRRRRRHVTTEPNVPMAHVRETSGLHPSDPKGNHILAVDSKTAPMQSSLAHARQ